HSVLEVVTRFRPDHRLVQSRHTYGASPALLLPAHRGCPMLHAAVQHAGCRRERTKCRDALVEGAPVPHVFRPALPPDHGAHALVRAHLWMAPAGFSLGPPRSFSLGVSASARYRRL